MNRKGGVFFAVIVGLMIFAVGMVTMNFIKDDTDTARNSANLDCNNSSISDGAKVTCLGVDLVVPYFLVVVLSLAGGYMASQLNL